MHSHAIMQFNANLICIYNKYLFISTEKFKPIKNSHEVLFSTGCSAVKIFGGVTANLKFNLNVKPNV